MKSYGWDALPSNLPFVYNFIVPLLLHRRTPGDAVKQIPPNIQNNSPDISDDKDDEDDADPGETIEPIEPDEPNK